IKMKEEKSKEKGVAIKDVEDSPRPIRSKTTLQPLLTIDLKDKGKGVLVEEEPEKPKKVKRRDQGLAQIKSDAELAQRLHEEELAEIDADHELAVRLTHEEQEKYIIKERARLLAKLFERRKKQLAAERVEAIRNKPPTRSLNHQVQKHLILSNQQDYNLISWRLFDLCGVHILLMNTGVPIHMMTEKKYPLIQEMLSRMLNRRLEVDYESEMAFELLKFTKSQLQK
ncbi:hypothetical protein Tco_0675659, partial [Tanacetum coccineum]